MSREENVTKFEILVLISTQWIDDLPTIHMTNINQFLKMECYMSFERVKEIH